MFDDITTTVNYADLLQHARGHDLSQLAEHKCFVRQAARAEILGMLLERKPDPVTDRLWSLPGWNFAVVVWQESFGNVHYRYHFPGHWNYERMQGRVAPVVVGIDASSEPNPSELTSDLGLDRPPGSLYVCYDVSKGTRVSADRLLVPPANTDDYLLPYRPDKSLPVLDDDAELATTPFGVPYRIFTDKEFFACNPRNQIRVSAPTWHQLTSDRVPTPPPGLVPVRISTRYRSVYCFVSRSDLDKLNNRTRAFEDHLWEHISQHSDEAELLKRTHRIARFGTSHPGARLG